MNRNDSLIESPTSTPLDNNLANIERRQFLKQGLMAAGATVALASGLGQMAQASLPDCTPNLQKHADVPSGLALMAKGVINEVKAKSFDYLLGQVPGLSDNQLKQHFKLYDNYVNKTNTIQYQISQADEAMLTGSNGAYSPYRELVTELSFNHNGVVLHELYFSNLGHKADPSSSLEALVKRDFKNWENYLAHLKAVAKSSRGWALTGLNLRDGHLRNYSLDMHHMGSPMGVYPILVLDVYEHAYMIDYGTDRSKYLDTFFNNINWETVNKRVFFAVHHLMTGPEVTI